MRVHVWLAVDGDELDQPGQDVELVPGKGQTLSFELPTDVFAGRSHQRLQVVLEPKRDYAETA